MKSNQVCIPPLLLDSLIDSQRIAFNKSRLPAATVRVL